jgi:hypothetical protein
VRNHLEGQEFLWPAKLSLTCSGQVRPQTLPRWATIELQCSINSAAGTLRRVLCPNPASCSGRAAVWPACHLSYIRINDKSIHWDVCCVLRTSAHTNHWGLFTIGPESDSLMCSHPSTHPNAEAGARKHRKRHAVLGARVCVQHHGDERRHVAYKDGEDALPPGHPCGAQEVRWGSAKLTLVQQRSSGWANGALGGWGTATTAQLKGRHRHSCRWQVQSSLQVAT